MPYQAQYLSQQVLATIRKYPQGFVPMLNHLSYPFFVRGGWGCGGRGWKGRLRSGPKPGWMGWPFHTIGAIGVGEDGAASTEGLTSIQSDLPDVFPALWVATVGSVR